MHLVAGEGDRVKINGLSAALSNSFQPRASDLSYHVNGVLSVNSTDVVSMNSTGAKKRVAVLISGSGSLFFSFLFLTSCDIQQGGHPPGKPGKVRNLTLLMKKSRKLWFTCDVLLQLR